MFHKTRQQQQGPNKYKTSKG